MSDQFILHQYDTSPFSEKPRLMFGLKGLAWSAVIQPSIMPKPDLVPLTGGYRRAPVMQLGADIFCDSQVIMAEIERRSPSPEPSGALDWAVNLWADRLFFQASVAVIFAELGETVPRAFIEDREKLSGRPFDVAAMKAASGPMSAQWRAQAAWIEQALAAGGPFLGGENASLADIAAYMNVWFVASFTPHLAAPLLAGLARVEAWRARVAAIGHGRRSEMTTGEALEVARVAKPVNFIEHDSADPLGLAPGASVMVMADDYGRDPIAGTLVAANAERVVIARDAGDLGRLHLHFPRVGYVVMAGG
jgi:glutathione S-transferase